MKFALTAFFLHTTYLLNIEGVLAGSPSTELRFSLNSKHRDA